MMEAEIEITEIGEVTEVTEIFDSSPEDQPSDSSCYPTAEPASEAGPSNIPESPEKTPTPEKTPEPKEYVYTVLIEQREKYSTQEVRHGIIELLGKPKYKHLAIKVIEPSLEKKTLSLGDIWISRREKGASTDDQFYESCCLIEVKQPKDLMDNLGPKHDHFRNQLNAMRDNEVEARYPILVAMGSFVVDKHHTDQGILNSRHKALTTLSLEGVFGSEKPLYTFRIPDVTHLPHFLVSLIYQLNSSKRIFNRTTLYRLNASDPRRSASDPRQLLQYSLQNVKGVGKQRAWMVSEMFASVEELINRLKEDGLEAFGAILQRSGETNPGKKNEVITEHIGQIIARGLGVELPKKVAQKNKKKSPPKQIQPAKVQGSSKIVKAKNASKDDTGRS